MYFFVYFLCIMVCVQIEVQAFPTPDSLYNGGTEEEKQIHKEIFLVPSELKKKYLMTVTGDISSKKETLTFSLVTKKKNEVEDSPDFKNVACQLKANFQDNTVMLKTYADGIEKSHTEDLSATEIFPGSNFSVAFRIEQEDSIELMIEQSVTTNTCKLKHKLNDITYMTIGGDVEKVEKIDFLLA